MGLRKVNHDFVSDIDVALAAFNEQQELSESQEREIKKHQAVFNKRDTASTEEEKDDLWDF